MSLFEGLNCTDENEQELWEDERRSNLANDINEMVFVVSDTDELQDVFYLLSDNPEAVNIVQWVATLCWVCNKIIFYLMLFFHYCFLFSILSGILGYSIIQQAGGNLPSLTPRSVQLVDRHPLLPDMWLS